MECLEQIIGITKDNCPCIQKDLTTEEIQELGISKSGLFLEELEGGLFLRNVVQLDKCKTFLEIQKSAIETAKKHYETDLLGKLNQKFQVKKTAFIGDIGRPSYTGSLDVSERLQFLKIAANKDSDAIVHLNSVRIFLNQDTTTKFWLYEIEEGQTEGRIILENEVSSQNQILAIPINAQLPLKRRGIYLNYYLIFERLGEVKPRNIKVSCGCSGGDGFSKFIQVSGGQSEGFSSLSTSSNDQFTHGFSIDVQIKCEAGNLICREYDGNDAISLVTAFAILYKAGELVIENVMNSAEVNRFTMLSREHLWGKRNHFRKEYFDRIDYLSKSIDVSSSDCFICRSDDFFLGHILN